MEGTQYIFGHDGNAMILKTVGATHTDLSGHLVVVAQTDVDETTHTCDILRKYRSFEGADGTCYDVYLIGCYYCDIDKTKPLKAEGAQARADIDFIAMETGVEL